MDYTSSPHPCMSLSTASTTPHNDSRPSSPPPHPPPTSPPLLLPPLPLPRPILPPPHVLDAGLAGVPPLPPLPVPLPANHLSPSSAALPFSYPVPTSLRGSGPTPRRWTSCGRCPTCRAAVRPPRDLSSCTCRPVGLRPPGRGALPPAPSSARPRRPLGAPLVPVRLPASVEEL